MMMYFNADERRVLYRKYRTAGFEHKEACEKVRVIVERVHKLVIKLNKENKSKKEIDEHFKKEFEKICRDIDKDRG